MQLRSKIKLKSFFRNILYVSFFFTICLFTLLFCLGLKDLQIYFYLFVSCFIFGILVAFILNFDNEYVNSRVRDYNEKHDNYFK